MASFTFQGKTYTLSDKAEKVYEKTMGWKPTEAVVAAYLHSAYNGEKRKNHNLTLKDITTSDIDAAMHSDLKIYANYSED